ncbi:hypothetical protein, unknown function [Leishmania donovani]|uniref:Uncharacterized protein n=1 Tax=Leishmania donovani TaxID=5661 RepID=A0A3S7X3I9_LEIDO|nr:hypothetical protein, unknown function [Leishmania donovani]AYU81023.1 hypothetical protein LdCL_300027900 [Leishmania donovani]TPP45786.1 hypothetical protein CGC21_35885 [Leishmania donovani]CBZ36245.1 hypothetical protein, unknown function [Leishmania donovani]
MRRRCLLVDTIRLSDFADMEAVLLRCPKFYAKESLVTVFPEAERRVRFIQAAQADGESSEANYYLLYTFQSSDFVPGGEPARLDSGELQKLTSEDDGAATLETSAAPSSVCSPLKKEEDGFSALIQYSPASVEWKDRSRERFFSFMAAAQARLEKRLGSANKSSSRFFMDWPDPATGLPLCTERGATIFCDADAILQFFSFNSVLIAGPGGGCRMIEHPRFGLNVYPAAGVLVLPRDAEEALRETIRSFAA